MASDTPEVLKKLEELGKPVRMQIGGHRATVWLTDYSESNDTYHGELHRNYSMNSSEKTPVVQSVHGIRFYPYDKQPLYAFQCVRPGEDEQPLIDIANGNVPEQAKKLTENIFGKPEEQSPSSVSKDPRDADGDGVVTKKEDRQYRRDHPDEGR